MQYKYLLDTHTHTIASGHAYNTISEMIASAKAKGLSLLAITEHAPNMLGTCHAIYFQNLKVLRREYDGLEVLFGAELNILDKEGNIDLDPYSLRELDIGIASMHQPCYEPGTMEENTAAYEKVMKNPYVNIIGHPDDGRFPVDFERLVKAAKENHVLLELNNNSLNPKSYRSNTKENDLEMLKLCKENDVPIVLGSDAHVADDILFFDYAQEIIDMVEFPQELIANTSVEMLKSFLNRK